MIGLYVGEHFCNVGILSGVVAAAYLAKYYLSIVTCCNAKLHMLSTV